jgi:hypothetical protein
VKQLSESDSFTNLYYHKNACLARKTGLPPHTTEALKKLK